MYTYIYINCFAKNVKFCITLILTTKNSKAVFTYLICNFTNRFGNIPSAIQNLR